MWSCSIYGFRDFVTVFCSESSSFKFEWDVYLPFTEAMNYALECLSNVKVEGLPDFKKHIAFVPCNRNVKSDRSAPGSSFKPDIAVMSIQDAYEFHGLGSTYGSKLSTFITKVKGKSPNGITNWKSVLSVVEMKRRPEAGWAKLGVFNRQETQVSIIPDVDKWLDERADEFQPATREIDVFSSGSRC
jgi:hypothetical protein